MVNTVPLYFPYFDYQHKSLSHLEQQEGKGKKESEDELEEEIVEEEFEDDYGVNHYESDDGFGSDGDAEATFD